MAKTRAPQTKNPHPEPVDRGSVVAPDWQQLPAHLEELLHIVPESGCELERTTLLTWLYRSKGVLNFLEVVERYQIPHFPATKRRAVRRALIGLARIGAVQLANITAAGVQNLKPEVLERESERNTSVSHDTFALITRAGMVWMNRAWTARHKAMANRPGMLEWAHRCFLDEEEEGKGTEGHWIESLGAGDYPRVEKPAGEVTAWIATPVASVFHLPAVIKPAKAPPKRLQRA